MSWAVELKANRDISIEDVAKAIDAIKREHDGLTSASRQSWGWAAACDVEMPKGNVLTVFGADFSYKYAPSFLVALAAALRALGYEITATNLYEPLSGGEKAAINYQREISDRERRRNPLGLKD